MHSDPKRTGMSEQDFVFRNKGDYLEFVGDFEGLYQTEVDPWGQSATSGPRSDYYAFSRAALADAIRRHVKVAGPGLEFGCGHGHVTSFLQKVTERPMWGVDISVMAVQRAAQLHPECNFVLGDLLAPKFVTNENFRFVILGQMLWYVLDNIDTAIHRCLGCIPSGGVFFVTQAFIKGQQMYGAEIANGFHGTLDLFMRRYADVMELIEARYEVCERFSHHDGLLVFRKK